MKRSAGAERPRRRVEQASGAPSAAPVSGAAPPAQHLVVRAPSDAPRLAAAAGRVRGAGRSRVHRFDSGRAASIAPAAGAARRAASEQDAQPAPFHVKRAPRSSGASTWRGPSALAAHRRRVPGRRFMLQRARGRYGTSPVLDAAPVGAARSRTVSRETVRSAAAMRSQPDGPQSGPCSTRGVRGQGSASSGYRSCARPHTRGAAHTVSRETVSWRTKLPALRADSPAGGIARDRQRARRAARSRTVSRETVCVRTDDRSIADATRRRGSRRPAERGPAAGWDRFT